MTFSLNNRLIVSEYKQTGLRTETKNGLAVAGQRDGICGLKVLVGTVLSDGRHIPAGSTAYFREETLYNMPWTKQLFKSPLLAESFLVADLHNVDFISTPDEAA